MKIFLPFKIKSIGGVTTFAEKFKEGMAQRGHEVCFDYCADYDVLFLIVQAPFKYLIDAKKNKKPIIQRMDGVWYWSVAGWKYPILNLKAYIIRHFFADYTIYQSKYSKYCVDRFLGKLMNEQSTIIFNGVNSNVFTPQGKIIEIKDNAEQKIFFTASAFRREDQILPLLKALKLYMEKYGDNFKLVVAGPFSGKVRKIPKLWSNFKNIQFVGEVDNMDLPCFERASDVFLFTHLNPPCPNNIIEAMSCGLPICGIADGAMPELVESGKNGMLIRVSGDAFWKIRSLDLNKFADNIHFILKNKKVYSEESRRSVKDNLTLEMMIDKYVEVLSRVRYHDF